MTPHGWHRYDGAWILMRGGVQIARVECAGRRWRWTCGTSSALAPGAVSAMEAVDRLIHRRAVLAARRGEAA